jgi:allantoicase
VSLEAIEAPATASVEALLDLPVERTLEAYGAHGGRAWLEVVPATAVRPDHRNVLSAALALPRATHVRLRIFPDGGVARLRLFGHVRPDPRRFWSAAAVDLAAIEHGGRIAAVSDAFFGAASHLLLPGRGADMGGGWETRRRRTPGSDWCVIRLGRRGRVERVEIDTHLFKGNAPQAAAIESLDAGGLDEAALARRLGSAEAWSTLLARTPLVPHHLHVLEIARPQAVTHLRVHIFPHGGVNRLRVFGRALDTDGDRRALAALHALDAAARAELLRSFCGARAFSDFMASRLPADSVSGVFAAAAGAFDAFTEPDWLEAFAAHPRLGAAQTPRAATAQSAAWSRGEQAGVAGADADALARLAAANEAYAERFGFVFIAFASGRGAGEVLALLEERTANDRATELANAAREQAQITRHRMESWFIANGAG